MNPGAISEQQMAPSLALKTPAKSSDFSSEPALFHQRKKSYLRSDMRNIMTSEIQSINVALKLIIQKILVKVLQRHLASQLPSQRVIHHLYLMLYQKFWFTQNHGKRKLFLEEIQLINKAAVCITNNDVLDKLKEEEKEAEKKRTAKKQERERKRVEKEKKKEEIAERKKKGRRRSRSQV